MYEIDSKIEGLGYDRDPRVDELLGERNSSDDFKHLENFILNNPESFSEQALKKATDEKHLTDLEQKHEQGEPFTGEDLVFLYEADSKVEGFRRWGRYHRIEKIISGRDFTEDVKTMLWH